MYVNIIEYDPERQPLARLTGPTIWRFRQSIRMFVLTSDPDVFMDLEGHLLYCCVCCLCLGVRTFISLPPNLLGQK